MKTAAIITIYDENNFGNRLQNYAVQEILKKRGIAATTIKNENFKSTIQLFKWVFIHRIKQLIKICFLKNKRVLRFLKFNKRYINCSRFYVNGTKKHNLRFDYYVVGSDQVWNPCLNRLSRLELLIDFDKEKSFALSASIGINSLDSHQELLLKQSIEDLRGVSVREDAAVSILEKIGFHNAIVLIDPTMMLTADEWRKISNKIENLPRKYLVTYFLGDVSENVDDMVIRICKKSECQLVSMGNNSISSFEGGPSEFLYVIDHAECVVTDSFHASVFSILFHKPFYVVNRKIGNLEVNSRIKTLLSKFSLKSRYIEDVESVKEIIGIDYRNSDSVLEFERKKFSCFLDRCI